MCLCANKHESSIFKTCEVFNVWASEQTNTIPLSFQARLWNYQSSASIALCCTGYRWSDPGCNWIAGIALPHALHCKGRWAIVPGSLQWHRLRHSLGNAFYESATIREHFQVAHKSKAGDSVAMACIHFVPVVWGQRRGPNSASQRL